MDLLAVSINVAVVAVVGGIVTWLRKGRFEALDRRIDLLDARVDRLETRLEGRIRLQASMDAMRSDLTQAAFAVGIRPRAQTD